MRGTDILTIFALVHLSGSQTSLKKISEITGQSISQVFDSLQRLEKNRVVSKNGKDIDFLTLEKLLVHALPFVIPGEIKGNSKGLPLSIANAPTLNMMPSSQSVRLIWPDDNHRVEGLAIDPICGEMINFIKKNPEYFEIASYIEVLRFHENPNRAKAVERIKMWISNISKGFGQASESNVDSAQILDKLSKLFSETGFRSNDFNSIEEKLNISSKQLLRNFGNLNHVQKAIAQNCADRAYAHLGQALMAPVDQRNEAIQKSLSHFFDFIDQNEDYFRLGLWFYVERLFELNEDAGVLKDQFFLTLEKYFEEVPSQKSSQARAAMFANSWMTYAWFRWVEFPRMKDAAAAQLRLNELRKTLVESFA